MRTFLFVAAGAALSLSLGWWGLPTVLYERVEQPLPFSHASHGEPMGMSCEDCHGFSEDGRFAGIPGVEACADCHLEPMTDDPGELRLVREYVEPGRDIPWKSYARQPDNVRFSHAVHVRLAGMPCERCHGDHGQSETLRPYERNRLSGYGRDIWGPSLVRLGREPWQGAKMGDCTACHHEHGVTESCLDCHK